MNLFILINNGFLESVPNSTFSTFFYSFFAGIFLAYDSVCFFVYTVFVHIFSSKE